MAERERERERERGGYTTADTAISQWRWRGSRPKLCWL